MGRIRTVKPEFWRNEALSGLPEVTHMLAAALLNYADDEGYFNANPKLVQAECLPLREPSVSVHTSLMQLASVGYLRLGIGRDNRKYGHIVKFLAHQRVSHPYASKIRVLDITWDDSVTIHGTLNDFSLLEREREEEKEKEKDSSDAVASECDFEEWYVAFPKHVGRGAALKAYRAARDKTAITRSCWERRSRRIRYETTEPRFIPMPATWLSQERWLDEKDRPPKPPIDKDRAAIIAMKASCI